MGGEKINKIAISALIIVAVGLVAGGFALVTNGDFTHVTDNLVSNEVFDASNGNVSLNNDPAVKDASLDKNQRGDLSLDSLENEVLINHATLMVNNVEDNSIATQFMNVVHSSGRYSDFFDNNAVDNQVFDSWKHIDKSEYVLSPNYAEHIFIKIGQDFTDKYGFCIVDGGFMPLGNVTKAISADRICTLSCGIDDCYFDLSSPNPQVYDYSDAEFYIKNGVFPSEIQKQQEAYISDYYNTNYRQVDGQDDVYVNVNQDFTDKYVLCMDCGRYVPLGTITTPLKDIMICDYPRHFGDNAYFDLDNAAVIGPDDAVASWDSFNEQRYSDPDYHPIHYDEPGYGEEDFSAYYSNNVESSQQNIDVNVLGNVSDCT